MSTQQWPQTLTNWFSFPLFLPTLCPSRIAAEVGRRLDTISIHLYSLSPSCTRESNSCFPGFVQLGMHCPCSPLIQHQCCFPWPAASQDEKAGGLGLGCLCCRESGYFLMTHECSLLSNWGTAEVLPHTPCCYRTCLAQPSLRHQCPMGALVFRATLRETELSLEAQPRCMPKHCV